MKKYYIGTSGWNYKHWVDVFYPNDLSINDWYSYYCRYYNTVEINMTFYKWPNKSTLMSWRNNSPKNFKVTIKAPRTITHIKRLNDVDEYIKTFESLLDVLGNDLGAVLYQLPPNFKLNQDNFNRLENFVKKLNVNFDNFIEFRDKSWWNRDVYDLLKYNYIGFCNIDRMGFSSTTITTHKRYSYYRFHGSSSNGGLYSPTQVRKFANIISSDGCEKKYVYFNNDQYGHAITNSKQLKEFLD